MRPASWPPRPACGTESAQLAKPPTLQAPAVLLRPYQPGDLPVFLAWMRDPNLWQEQAVPLPAAADLCAEALTETFHALTVGTPGRLFWIMAEADTDRPVGQASLERDPPEANVAEVGLEIPEVHHRRRGLGRQALDLLTQFAFAELKLSRLVAHTHSENRPSQRLFEAAGFRLAERRSEGLMVQGQPVQTLIYEKLCPGG